MKRCPREGPRSDRCHTVRAPKAGGALQDPTADKPPAIPTLQSQLLCVTACPGSEMDHAQVLFRRRLPAHGQCSQLSANAVVYKQWPNDPVIKTTRYVRDVSPTLLLDTKKITSNQLLHPVPQNVNKPPRVSRAGNREASPLPIVIAEHLPSASCLEECLSPHAPTTSGEMATAKDM